MIGCLARSGVLLLGIAGFCGAQQNGVEMASVSGRVIDSAGKPIQGATVALDLPWRGTGINVQPKPPAAYSALTDALGRFEFPEVRPVRYQLFSVKLAGYIDQRYGSEFGMGALTLASGQKLTDVTFKLIRGGIITGRVLDQDGKPVADLQMGAARRSFSPGGAPLSMHLDMITGKDGAFSLGGIPPGVYYVFAMSPDGQGGEAYLKTYYPSAADASNATAVPIAEGATVHIADMHLRKTRVYRIRGKIVDTTTGAAPPNRVMLTIQPQDPASARLGSWGGRTEAGTFDEAFFAPGVYIVNVAPATAPPGVKPPLSLVGRQIVTVPDADVDTVLKVSPALEISGHVTPAVKGRILLGGTDGLTYAGFLEIQADGSFTVYSLAPAVYRVRALDLPEGMYIRSIRYGDGDASRDITTGVLDLTSGVKGQLNIQLAPGAGGIAGAVRDASGVAMEGVVVTMWTPGLPANSAADFAQTSISGADGEFKFSNLPPGEYRVAAWERIDPGLGTLPAFRVKFEGRATVVKLKESDRARVELVEIPASAIEAAMVETN